MNCERTIFYEMKIPLKWKTCTRYCVSTCTCTCTSTCTSTCPIFAIANFTKCNGTLKVLDIQLLQECINFEMKIADKTFNFISLYRSASQSKDESESFADNFELNLDSTAHRNPYLIVVLGDFNAQTKGWYPLGKTTYEGTRIDGITS